MRGLPALLPILALLAGGPVQAATAPAYDVILRHGTVFDGTGAPGRVADVGVIGGRIAAVGDLSRARGRIEREVRSLYVAPGFINIHSHLTPAGLQNARNMLTQGVTTEVVNADGGGSTDIAAQLASYAVGPMALNVGAYVGFNSIWQAVVGLDSRRPSPGEITRMRGLITRNLAAGAFGVSAGLDYAPGVYATTDEVVGVVSAAKGWRTNFPNHERVTAASGFSGKVGIAETIRIASAAGLAPEITHIKAQGVEQGEGAEILTMMDRASGQGHFTTGDVYPYLAGQTGLHALIIPAWAQVGGRATMLARFRDPAQRPRIVAEAEATMNARFGGPKGVFVLTTHQALTDLMATGGVSAGEALIRAIEAAPVDSILTFGAEPDLVAFLRHPNIAIACDCGASTSEAVHPRFYGTYPRVLGRYVRTQGVLTWPEAIRKMTGLPASIVGLADRGLLSPGMAADIVAFNPRTIEDHATYDSPTLLSDGVSLVLVNGGLALDHGKPTGGAYGQPLRRGPHTPTRPMVLTPRGLRILGDAVASDGGRIRIQADLRAMPGAPTRGTVVFRGPGWPRPLMVATLGVLQTAAGWASLTGWTAPDTAGPGQPFSLIVDQANPLDPSGLASITLTLGDRTRTLALPKAAIRLR